MQEQFSDSIKTNIPLELSIAIKSATIFLEVIIEYYFETQCEEFVVRLKGACSCSDDRYVEKQLYITYIPSLVDKKSSIF